MADMKARNTKAKNNGEWGEKIAEPILKEKFGDVEFVNELIDYYSKSGIYIEVKTCQDKVKRGEDGRYPTRSGKFKLEKDQHDFLMFKDGYYLFLVKSGSLLVAGKVIKARDVPFAKTHTWNRLLGVGMDGK